MPTKQQECQTQLLYRSCLVNRVPKTGVSDKHDTFHVVGAMDVSQYWPLVRLQPTVRKCGTNQIYRTCLI